MKKIFLNVIGFGALIMSMFSCSEDPRSENLISLKSDSLPDKIDYNLHVRPILSDKCFNCHGPDKNKREAGLRLDNDESYKKVEGHYPIVPKHPGQSEVMARIFSDDPELKMPLPSSNLSLTELEKAIIAKWIKQGAIYKPHWAFIKPEKQLVPDIQNKNWAVNEIDNFIFEKLDKAGMNPSQEASKEKLMRRVYIDLTGLPPTIAQQDSFLSDKSANAYEKLVDKLLAKPQYGERMANEWMDVARYADSHGYQDDGESEMWPWRDWVIKAFNQNLPYDKFITYQMAGDLLPNATKEQILATGFNRNHMINAEGGIIDEEFRTEYVLDRVNTTGKAFLALTVECSRCHDHKYDPISQKEFYQMSAFFNHMDEQGKGNLYENTTGPTLLLTDEKTDEQLKFIKEKIFTQEQKIAALRKTKNNQSTSLKINGLDENFKKHLVAYYSFDNQNPNDSTIVNLKDASKNGKLSKTLHFEAGKIGNALMIDGDERTDFSQIMYDFERTQPFSGSMWINTPKYSDKGFTLFANCATTYHGFRGYDLILNKNKVQFRLNNSYPSNALEVATIDTILSKTWNHIAFTYDGSSKAEGINIYINGKKQKVDILLNNLYKTTRTHTVEEDRKLAQYYDELKKKRPLTMKEEKIVRQLGFKAWYSKPHSFSIGGRKDQGYQPFFDGKIDEFKIYDKDLSELEIKADYENRPLSKVLAKATNSQLMALKLSYQDKEWQLEQENLKALRDYQNNIVLPIREVKIMKERPTKRETFILNRGNYDAPTDKVEEGAIKVVMLFDKKFEKNRMGLAKWLTDANNPLTARVAVNRYWQLIFGTGLVTTSADFGNQGNMPTHPELLDYLAIDFVNSGWDLKLLLRKMVMSATYRQSSTITPDNYSKDPQNLLYGRALRYRYGFEIIRDNALQAAGILNTQVGGKSFKPYQPIGLWEEKTEAPVNNYYEEDVAPEIYRRSMYIVLKRTSPHPSYNAFDGPERFTCQVKRQSTNTPIQALITLNDPQFLEAARVLAQNEMEKSTNTEQKIESIFLKVLNRKPLDNELFILRKVFQSETAKFKQSPQKADEFINAGVYPINKKLNKGELAAWALIAHTVMNLDESMSRE